MLQKREMNNVEIADLLRNVAASYQIKDAQKYKFNIIAYERAADSIEHLSSEAKDIYDEGKLDDIPGVGKSIAKHLADIFKTGNSPHFNKIFENVPEAVFELLPLEGIGPKNAYKLVQEFNIKSPGALAQLKKLALENKISNIAGFGIESQSSILKALNSYKGRSKRLLLNYAESVSDLIVEWMKKDNEIIALDTLGSLRRKDSTIGDIDIACATNNIKKAVDHFTNYPHIIRVLEKGDAKASILIPPNIQIDMRFQDPESYGALLQHFTGSKHHNIALREYANNLKPRLSLSEYGIKISNNNGVKKFKDEKEFYNFLKLAWIPPELRENTGEIEASLRQVQGKLPGLPKLVELTDIKGDLQIHSNYDIETSHDLGMSSIADIASKAKFLNYEYVALTDHNPSHSKHSPYQIIDIIKRRKEFIDNYNSKVRVIKLFNSLEIDILSNGSLPVPDKAFDYIDFALVSIHSSFRSSKETLTKRVINALSYPKVKIFAHPTARKINEREGVELQWDIIFEYCRKNNKFIEINADPMRLDLPDHLVKEAVKYGVRLSIGTDAHHVDHMDNLKYAINVARRGWVENKNIINSLSLHEIEKILII